MARARQPLFRGLVVKRYAVATFCQFASPSPSPSLSLTPSSHSPPPVVKSRSAAHIYLRLASLDSLFRDVDAVVSLSTERLPFFGCRLITSPTRGEARDPQARRLREGEGGKAKGRLGSTTQIGGRRPQWLPPHARGQSEILHRTEPGMPAPGKKFLLATKRRAAAAAAAAEGQGGGEKEGKGEPGPKSFTKRCGRCAVACVGATVLLVRPVISAQ